MDLFISGVFAAQHQEEAARAAAAEAEAEQRRKEDEAKAEETRDTTNFDPKNVEVIDCLMDFYGFL